MDYKVNTIASTFWMQAGKLLEFTFTLVISIVLARSLGPTKFGIYSSLIAYFSLFAVLISFGLEQSLNTFIPKFGKDGYVSQIGTLYATSIFLRLIALCFIITLSVYFRDYISVTYFKDASLSYLILFSGIFFLFKNLSTLLSFFYLSLLNTKFVTIVSNITLLSILFATSVVLLQKKSLELLFTIYALIYLVTTLIYLYYSKTYLVKGSIFNVSKDIISFSKLVWLTNIFRFLLHKQADIFLLQILGIGFIGIAYYSVTFSIVDLSCTILISGILSISLPILSGFYSAGDIDRVSKGWRVLLYYGNAFSTPILIFLIFHAKIILTTIYSSDYSAASPLLQTFATFSLIGRIFGGGINTSLLYVIDKATLPLIYSIIGGFLNVILNLILIPKIGAYGAIISTGVSNLLITYILFRYTLKFTNATYPYISILKILLISLVAGYLSSLYNGSSILSLLLMLLIYSLIFVTLSFIIKPFYNEDLKHFTAIPLLHRCLKVFSA